MQLTCMLPGLSPIFRPRPGEVYLARPAAAVSDDRVPAETDRRYRRLDNSQQHAHEARQAFLRCVAGGEASINLAQAALHIAQEDDALVSHGVVRLPLHPFQQRIRRLAEEAAARLERLGAMASDREPDVVLQVVLRFLWQEKGFRLPSSGQSNLKAGYLYDSPGVYEDARNAYLTEALVRRQGTAAVLAILLAEVMQQLLRLGAIDFAVRTDCSDFGRLPVPQALPGMTRRMVLQPDGTMLNTCTWDALLEALRYLQRAYWPFPWSSAATQQASTGGFVGAAKVALEGEEDAALQAVSRSARHRLERGIWTSPGAGDLRRAKAACERLAIMCGDQQPSVRRDLGIILLHCGQSEQALAELQAFRRSPAAGEAQPDEQHLLGRLLDMLQRQDLGFEAQPLSLQTALTEPAPQHDADARTPLTW